MALNNRTKLGITLAVAVLAGLASIWLAVLVLVLAAFLIAWGQVPERTEAFVELLPGGNYLLKALARIDLLLWPPGLGQKDLAQEDYKRIWHTRMNGIWHKRNISEIFCEDIAPQLDELCAS